MDNTLCSWNIKPFSPSSRLLNTFHGAPHGFEKNLIRPCWSPDSDFVAVGSGDRSVVVWNASTGNIAYKLPGHKGCVNQVDWYGNVLASGASDGHIFLGELNLSEVK
jgi:Prp8 binding protein